MTNTQTNDQLFALIAEQRRAIADQLDTLTPTQWETQSLCQEWTVRQVAAHLTLGWNASTPKFAFGMLRHRGNFDTLNVELSNKLAERSTAEILTNLRDNAEHRFTPPGAGAMAPLADSVVHGYDMWVPLGIDSPTTDESKRVVLTAAASPTKKSIFAMKDSTGLNFAATDLDWASGSGATVSGPAGALLLALHGRAVGFDELTGDGVADFRQRMAV